MSQTRIVVQDRQSDVQWQQRTGLFSSLHCRLLVCYVQNSAIASCMEACSDCAVREGEHSSRQKASRFTFFSGHPRSLNMVTSFLLIASATLAFDETLSNQGSQALAACSSQKSDRRLFSLVSLVYPFNKAYFAGSLSTKQIYLQCKIG